jgi:hypothetical protein
MATHIRLDRGACDPPSTVKVRLNHKKYELEMSNCEFTEILSKNNVYAYLTNKFDTQLANM